jgi:DNA invertase Pin-like site-specific DNA recombinase
VTTLFAPVPEPTDERPVAIGYVRVSTDQQAEHGNGLDIQRDALHVAADSLGYHLAVIYTDEGISGKEGIEGRRGLADALADLHAGRATIIPKLDRLARDMLVQEQVLADAWRAGAQVISAVETERVYCQPDNPDDPSRALIRQILGAVAAYERAMIRARLVTGRRRRIADVGYAGGPEPYGWTDPTERAVLQHIEFYRQTHMTWRQIRDGLHLRGYLKRNGEPWTTQEVQRAHARAARRGQIEAVPLPVIFEQPTLIGANA